MAAPQTPQHKTHRKPKSLRTQLHSRNVLIRGSTSLTRHSALYTHDVFLRASSGTHAHLHEAFALLVTPFILNSKSTWLDVPDQNHPRSCQRMRVHLLQRSVTHVDVSHRCGTSWIRSLPHSRPSQSVPTCTFEKSNIADLFQRGIGGIDEVLHQIGRAA